MVGFEARGRPLLSPFFPAPLPSACPARALVPSRSQCALLAPPSSGLRIFGFQLPHHDGEKILLKASIGPNSHSTAQSKAIIMTKTLFLLTAFLAAQEANAFAPSAGSIDKAIGGLRMVDDAQVLSDYMAKSHEEKLRAIKEVEDKKNSEIAVSNLAV